MSKFEMNIFKLGEIHHEDLTCYISLQDHFKLDLIHMFKLGSLRHESTGYLQQTQARLARITEPGVGVHKSRNVIKIDYESKIQAQLARLIKLDTKLGNRI